MKKFERGEMQYGSRGNVLLYTNKSWIFKEFCKWIFITLFSPIWLPLFIFMYVGRWSETAIDFLENQLKRFLQLVVKRDL